jgi:hypothetical protein
LTNWYTHKTIPALLDPLPSLTCAVPLNAKIPHCALYVFITPRCDLDGSIYPANMIPSGVRLRITLDCFSEEGS